MFLLRSADEADRGHAIPVPIERCLRRLDQRRAVRQAEIIIRAEIQDPLPRDHGNLCRLLRGDHPLGMIKALLMQRLEPGREMFEKAVHLCSPTDTATEWHYGRAPGRDRPSLQGRFA